MIVLIAHHYAYHGLMGYNSEILFNNILITILNNISRIGVALFVIISGYLNVNKQFTFKRFWKLEGQIVFYCLLAAIFYFTIEGTNNFNFHELIKIFFPLTNSQYWFMTIFMVLMCMTPFINTFMNNCNKRTLQYGIFIFTIIWTILNRHTTSDFGFNNLTWFILLYSTGAYIKLHIKLTEKTKKNSLIIMFVSIILYIGYYTLSKLFPNIETYTNSFMISSEYFIALIISTSVFVYFIGKQIKQNRIINLLGSTTFAVFLFHDSVYLRNFLWDNVFRCYKVYNTNMLVPHMVFTVIAIFAFVLIIDTIRKHFFENIWLELCDKITNTKLYARLTFKQ